MSRGDEADGGRRRGAHPPPLDLSVHRSLRLHRQAVGGGLERRVGHLGGGEHGRLEEGVSGIDEADLPDNGGRTLRTAGGATGGGSVGGRAAACAAVGFDRFAAGASSAVRTGTCCGTSEMPAGSPEGWRTAAAGLGGVEAGRVGAAAAGWAAEGGAATGSAGSISLAEARCRSRYALRSRDDAVRSRGRAPGPAVRRGQKR